MWIITIYLKDVKLADKIHCSICKIMSHVNTFDVDRKLKNLNSCFSFTVEDTDLYSFIFNTRNTTIDLIKKTNTGWVTETICLIILIWQIRMGAFKDHSRSASSKEWGIILRFWNFRYTFSCYLNCQIDMLSKRKCSTRSMEIFCTLNLFHRWDALTRMK